MKEREGKIPDNWKIKKYSKYNVLNLDLPNRYVEMEVFSHPEETRYVEYFFNDDGQYSARRDVGYSQGQPFVFVEKTTEVGNFSVSTENLRDRDRFKMVLVIDLSNTSSISHLFSYISDYPTTVVGSGVYFHEDIPANLEYSFLLDGNGSILDTEVVKTSPRYSDATDVDKSREKELFDVEYSAKDGIFVFRQGHKASGIVKTISAPLRVDVGKIRSALSSKAPYGKDSRGNLIVPWKDIDRLVGASLSYSYPPPK